MAECGTISITDSTAFERAAASGERVRAADLRPTEYREYFASLTRRFARLWHDRGGAYIYDIAKVVQRRYRLGRVL